jgi:hypothetical protein
VDNEICTGAHVRRACSDVNSLNKANEIYVPFQKDRFTRNGIQFEHSRLRDIAVLGSDNDCIVSLAARKCREIFVNNKLYYTYVRVKTTGTTVWLTMNSPQIQSDAGQHVPSNQTISMY